MARVWSCKTTPYSYTLVVYNVDAYIEVKIGLKNYKQISIPKPCDDHTKCTGTGLPYLSKYL